MMTWRIILLISAFGDYDNTWNDTIVMTSSSTTNATTISDANTDVWIIMIIWWCNGIWDDDDNENDK